VGTASWKGTTYLLPPIAECGDAVEYLEIILEETAYVLLGIIILLCAFGVMAGLFMACGLPWGFGPVTVACAIMVAFVRAYRKEQPA